jgi:hypothetical protein
VGDFGGWNPTAQKNGGTLSTNMEFIQSNCFEFNDGQTTYLVLLQPTIQFTAKQQYHLHVSVKPKRLASNT